MRVSRIASITASIFVVFIAAIGSSAFEENQNAPFSIFVTSDRLTFTEGEPVYIKAHIKNNTGKTSSFAVYDVAYTTFQPVAYGMQGLEAETTVKYRLMNRTVEDLLRYIEPRSSVIGSDETITKKLNLADFYALEAGQEYRVSVFFMPDAKTPYVIRSDNSITIRVVKSERYDNQPAEPMDEPYSGRINPSEAVQLFLSAEKGRHWKNMIKYIDLESYIMAYSDYAMQYNAGSEPVRKKVLRDFVRYLSTSRTDYIVDFNITNESILDDRQTAYVDVSVTRFAAPRPFVYNYRYTLVDHSGAWLVSNVEVTVSKERALNND